MIKKHLLLVLLSLVLLAAVLIASDPIRLYTILLSSDLLILIMAFVLANIAVLFRILKWWVIVEEKFTAVAPVQMVGVAIGNFTPGKAAEPIKAVALKLKTGSSVSYTLPSIVWERVFDIFVVILFSVFAVFFIGVESNLFFLSLAGVVAMGLLVVVALLVLVSRKIGTTVILYLLRLPLLRRLPKNFAKLFYKKKVSKNRLIVAFTFTAVTWILEGFVLNYSLLSIGYEISIIASIGIVALAIAIGFASLLPGGIGSTEAVMILLLIAIGVPSGAAAAAAIITRSFSFWYNNILGVASFSCFRNLSRIINTRT